MRYREVRDILAARRKPFGAFSVALVVETGRIVVGSRCSERAKLVFRATHDLAVHGQAVHFGQNVPFALITRRLRSALLVPKRPKSGATRVR